MKTLKTVMAAQVSWLVIGAVFAGVSSQPLDLTTGSNWRTAANPAIEADGQYGSEGYVLFGVNLANNSYTASGYNILPGNANNQYNLPSYVSAVAVPAGVSYSMWSGNGNFGQIQDPANGNALTPTPALLRATRPGDPCDLTLQRATSRAFRLTVLIGISSDGGYANNAVTLTVNAGATGSASGNTGAAPNGGQAGTPGMMYMSFDVGSGTEDILVRLAGSGANLAGLAFDPVPVTPPSITQQPVGATCLVGVALPLAVAAAGSDPLAYQWYRGPDPVPDATNATLNFPSLQLTDAGTYMVVITNAQGTVTSTPALLGVETALPDKLVRFEEAVLNELFLFASYPFDYRNADDALGVNPGTLVGTTRFGAGVAGGANQALLLNGGGHVSLGTTADFTFPTGLGAVEAWVRADWSANPGYAPCLLANRDGTPTRYSLHLMPNKDQIAFWNGTALVSAAIPAAGTNWHLLAFSFNSGSWTIYWDGQPLMTLSQTFGLTTGLPTQLGSSSSAATTEGWIGALDEVSFFSDVLSAEQARAHYVAFAVGDPPAIQLQPQGGFFFVGSPLSLSAFATGAELAFQWYKDGAPVNQATNTALEFASLTSGDSGAYHLVVTNAAGSATSAVARLDVRVPDPLRYRSVVSTEPSLISFYPFEGDSANDAVSTNHGTLGGTFTFAPGLGGAQDQALILSGGGYVGLGTAPDFAFGGGIGTVEAWVRADWDVATPPPYNPCLLANRNDLPTRWSLHLMQDKSRLAFWNGGGAALVAIPPVGNAWHLFTSVFDSGSWRVYWDGQPIATNALPLGGGTGLPTQIGSTTSTNAAEAWVGGLNEVAFYRAALSGAQARAHYLAMIDPALHFAHSGSSLTLSWPEGLQGFTLEWTATLPAAAWEPVPDVVNNRVTVDTSAGSRFYRLRR